jgi:hypothetical protein
VTGPMWPWIRGRSWIPEGIKTTFPQAALDVRIWIAILLLIFVYGVGPEIYQRMITTRTLPGTPVATGEAWDKLTTVQQSALERALKDLPKRDQFEVICLNNDCKDVASNFMHALNAAGWSPVLGTGMMFNTEPFGLNLYQKDVTDQSLAKAIETATGLKIEHIFQATFPNDSIFVGIRP